MAVSNADGKSERATALAMLDTLPGQGPKTLGADKAYDTRDFVAACRAHKVSPPVASHQKPWVGSAIDGRTTRHAGYRASQILRRRIEEHLGWDKSIGRIRQTVFRGLRRVDQQFKLTMTANNLVRMARILLAPPKGSAPRKPKSLPMTVRQTTAMAHHFSVVLEPNADLFCEKQISAGEGVFQHPAR